MRQGKRYRDAQKGFACLLSLLMLLPCFGFAETSDAPKYEYEGDRIHVWVEEGTMEGTRWMAAHVQIQTPEQLTNHMAGKNSKDKKRGFVIAQEAGAVLAVNGDLMSANKSPAGRHLVRNGKLIYAKASGLLDTLIIDQNGDFRILLKATEEDIQAFEEEIINCYTFGPALVVDGKMVTEFQDHSYSAFKPAQRMAICQTGPLSYLCIATSGPDHRNSKGMTIRQFAALVASFPDVIQAYNLDGGSSAQMIFNGEKINLFGKKGSASIADVICFLP
ncbi:MAG: phosphodiester glycosidase family protein [Clostridia bacterium]|nr:phosphodiester glycosidase family protein [Clostridia bacterium]